MGRRTRIFGNDRCECCSCHNVHLYSERVLTINGCYCPKCGDDEFIRLKVEINLMTEQTKAQPTLDDMLVELRKIKHWQEKASTRESELRYAIKDLLEQQMKINRGHEGVQTVADTVVIEGRQFKLQVEQKINRSLDQKKVAEVQKSLPKTVAAKLFKTKFDFSVAEMRKLTPDNLAKFQACLKESASLPTIKLVPVDEAE